MTCLWCHEQEATEDLYCAFCATSVLTAEDKAHIDQSFEAAAWRIGKALEDLKQTSKAALPRWLRWIV